MYCIHWPNIMWKNEEVYIKNNLLNLGLLRLTADDILWYLWCFCVLCACPEPKQIPNFLEHFFSLVKYWSATLTLVLPYRLPFTIFLWLFWKAFASPQVIKSLGILTKEKVIHGKTPHATICGYKWQWVCGL